MGPQAYGVFTRVKAGRTESLSVNSDEILINDGSRCAHMRIQKGALFCL
uniref:Uncharacterized protein n=1 Tax=Anguilla anguilla TaxID=7936 RepID=A0A0E9SCX9_ANGAN